MIFIKQPAKKQPEQKTTIYDLGKLHRWWLLEFKRASKINGKYSMGVSGNYFHGPYGNALKGLMKKGLVERDTSFETLFILRLTEAGIKISKQL